MAVKGKILGKGQSLNITEAQLQELFSATTGSGGNQTLCTELHRRAKRTDGALSTLAYPKELERMTDYAGRNDNGTWQRIYREILVANGLL